MCLRDCTEVRSVKGSFIFSGQLGQTEEDLCGETSADSAVKKGFDGSSSLKRLERHHKFIG